MTAYLVAGWMVANQAPVPTKAQVRGVWQQVARAMEANPPAGSVTERQIAAEQMMYDLVLIVAANTEGQQTRDTAGLTHLARETAAAYRVRGVDLQHISLTEAGFEPR
jgi:hypothetical protein